MTKISDSEPESLPEEVQKTVANVESSILSDKSYNRCNFNFNKIYITEFFISPLVEY